MTNAIEVKNLRRVYRHYEKGAGLMSALKSTFWRKWVSVDAVNGISFTIPQGSFVGFLGPNGAGKTTTLKMLSGILSPSSGTCRVLGFNPSDRKKAFKKQIALVMGQKSQLIWDLPPTDTFVLHRDLYEIPRAEWNETLSTLTKLLRVEHVLDTPVRQLSLGERMKCELIVALLHKPKVLFLDEPTIGLDIISRIHLWEFLRTYQKKENITVLLTSHYVHDIANLCQKVIIINTGKIVFDGLFDTLIEKLEPERRGIIRFHQESLKTEQLQQIAKMVKDRHLEQVDEQTFRISVPRNQLTKATEWIFKSFPIEEMRMEEVDLRTVIERAFALDGKS